MRGASPAVFPSTKCSLVSNKHELHGDVEAIGARSVAGAANSIDVLLRINPAEQGESREGDSRVLIIRPPAVAFDVLLAVREMPGGGRPPH